MSASRGLRRWEHRLREQRPGALPGPQRHRRWLQRRASLDNPHLKRLWQPTCGGAWAPLCRERGICCRTSWQGSSFCSFSQSSLMCDGLWGPRPGAAPPAPPSLQQCSSLSGPTWRAQGHCGAVLTQETQGLTAKSRAAIFFMLNLW